MITIYKPIIATNEGSRRKVGLAEHKLWREGEMINVEIVWTRKNGIRHYPNPFIIPRNIVLRYPTQWKDGVRLYIVPIDAMREVIRQ